MQQKMVMSNSKIYTTMARTKKMVEEANNAQVMAAEAAAVAKQEHTATKREAAVNKVLEERKSLKELCKQLPEGEPINKALRAYYMQHGATELKSREEWEQEGFKVSPKAVRYPVWGLPTTKLNNKGESFKFYPVKHLYDKVGLVTA